MQALILANGKGTNLRPLTVYTPKPIVPILNVPLLLYQIEMLKRAGIDQITLFLDYQPDKIEHLLGTEQELGIELRYVVEPEPLGTAGAYKFSSKYSSEPVVVLNGDILTDFVISKLIKKHQESDAVFSMAIKPIEPNSKYGLVRIDKDNLVSEYLPDAAGAPAAKGYDLMNAGIYVIEPKVADSIPTETPLSFKHDVFPELGKKFDGFYGVPIDDSYWCSIDSVEKYLEVHRDFLDNKVRHFSWENTADFEVATSAYVDEASVIGNDCIIKPNAKVINSVLGKGIQVEENAVIRNSVLWSHSRVSNSAVIVDSVLAGSCYIGKNVLVGKGSVLGDKASLTDYTRV